MSSTTSSPEKTSTNSLIIEARELSARDADEWCKRMQHGFGLVYDASRNEPIFVIEENGVIRKLEVQ